NHLPPPGRVGWRPSPQSSQFCGASAIRSHPSALSTQSHPPLLRAILRNGCPIVSTGRVVPPRGPDTVINRRHSYASVGAARPPPRGGSSRSSLAMRMHRSPTVSPLQGGAQVYWLPPEHRPEVGTSSCGANGERTDERAVLSEQPSSSASLPQTDVADGR